jgi:hypothetical protein
VNIYLERYQSRFCGSRHKGDNFGSGIALVFRPRFKATVSGLYLLKVSISSDSDGTWGSAHTDLPSRSNLASCQAGTCQWERPDASPVSGMGQSWKSSKECSPSRIVSHWIGLSEPRVHETKWPLSVTYRRVIFERTS